MAAATSLAEIIKARIKNMEKPAINVGEVEAAATANGSAAAAQTGSSSVTTVNEISSQSEGTQPQTPGKEVMLATQGLWQSP